MLARKSQLGFALTIGDMSPAELATDSIGERRLVVTLPGRFLPELPSFLRDDFNGFLDAGGTGDLAVGGGGVVLPSDPSKLATLPSLGIAAMSLPDALQASKSPQITIGHTHAEGNDSTCCSQNGSRNCLLS